ncbi:MAG: WecB/TagA/CpsF family glycosyltransferase [Bacillota bacterium]|nr:WecB/TagA/CpsF family glycosyltransferase [Bacillota bacterium]
MDKIDVLGAQVNKVTIKDAVNVVAGFIDRKTPHQVITLNAEIIYLALSEPRLMSIINSAHLVTPDGAGVVLASKILGEPLSERVTGIDLMQELVKISPAKGWRLFFFGGAPGVADEAAANLKATYEGLQIVGVQHGYLKSKEEEKALLLDIIQAKPDILFVALGAPKQEYWIKEHLAELKVPVAIGVGGSFDVLSGRIARAPELYQKLQLEWLYRLVKEPYRYKRMLALPKFMLKIIKQKLR